jgi:hypothetical protein
MHGSVRDLHLAFDSCAGTCVRLAESSGFSPEAISTECAAAGFAGILAPNKVLLAGGEVAPRAGRVLLHRTRVAQKRRFPGFPLYPLKCESCSGRLHIFIVRYCLRLSCCCPPAAGASRKGQPPAAVPQTRLRAQARRRARATAAQRWVRQRSPGCRRWRTPMVRP